MFGHLDEKSYDLDQLFANTPVRSFPRKADIFNSTHDTDGLYRIVTGRVRASVIMEDGQILTMNTIGPGEPFPLPIYFKVPSPPTIIYTTETAVTARWSPREATDAFLYSHPEALYRLVKLVFEVLYGRINTLSRNTAEKKVLQRLMELSERWGEPTEDTFEITTTQQEIADSANLSRESVNIILNKLADSNVLKMGRGKIFMDIAKAKAELARIVKPGAELCEPGAATTEAGDLDLM